MRFTMTARDELDGLGLWISIDTGPNAANRVLSRIDRALQNLAAFPEIGRSRPDLLDSPRTFSVHSWLLVYEPLVGERGIRVMRVLDGRRDIQALLGRDR